MQKLKLVTIVGTRPEIIRLSEVIKRCDQLFDHKLLHTGQNWAYELNQIFFDDLGLRAPDQYLDAVGESLGKTIGNIIAKSYQALQALKPDALLVLGDTNSCLASIAAKRLKIPIFHMEAGNRCFDQNVPEEINRKIVDVVSDVNLAYTEHSRRYLLSEGAKKDFVFVTGSPIYEVLNANMKKIETSDILNKLGLAAGDYIVLSAHREENIDLADNFEQLVAMINAVAERYNKTIVYSVHPRSKKQIEAHGIQFSDKVRELEPFSFTDYNALQKNAFVVISDSGTLSEESAMLSFPGVLIRTSTERPESLDAGTVVVGGIKAQDVLQSIELVRAVFEEGKGYQAPDIYQVENVSEIVARIIQSYTKIVNQVIWRKS